MKRTELYAMVWSKPMTRLSAELGVSDVGLAKACRRHAIPVPPRGHWAKLQAGKPSEQIPLPEPDLNVEVTIATATPARRQARVDRKLEAEAVILEKAEQVRRPTPTRKTLDERPNPLVRATAEYCARLPARVKRWERLSPTERLYTDESRPPSRENGRWILDVPEGLILIASDAALTWALAFLDRVLKALTAVDVKVLRQPGKDREPSSIACVLGAERLTLGFREGYRRVTLTAAEFARVKAERSWARDWEYVPSGVFTLTLQGSEHAVAKAWAGRQDKLDALTDEIVATCLSLLESQPKRRAERLEEEHRRRVEADRAERHRRIAQGRLEQLERAFKAAEAHERVERLHRFLAVVEAELGSYTSPYDERARVWLGVVRDELQRSNPYLEILGGSLSVPAWASWPPEWWPAAKGDDAHRKDHEAASGK